jgi:hypothetical protein
MPATLAARQRASVGGGSALRSVSPCQAFRTGLISAKGELSTGLLVAVSQATGRFALCALPSRHTIARVEDSRAVALPAIAK